MFINEITKYKEVSKLKQKKKVANSGFVELLDIEGAESTSETQATQNTSALDSLFALQEFLPESTIRNSNIKRGEDLLDKLSKFKNAIISKNITSEQLKALQRDLKLERAKSNDEKLEELIDEIELRAEIELAKLENS